MPTPNPYKASVGIDPVAPFNRATFYAALESNGIQPFENVGQVQDFNAGTMRAVAFNGRIFHRDFTDTTTAHDGVNVLVTLDGKRFKSEARLQINTVETAGLNTPPSPTNADFGKAWQIGAAPTGVWAAKGNQIAVWTALGWFYFAPGPGVMLFAKDNGSFYHFSNGSGWLLGLGALSTAAGSVAPTALQWPLGITVQAIQNTPPGGIANAYIVGAAPAGAWAGQTGKVANAVAGAWQFLAPYEGATVWEAANKRALTYTSGVWTSQTKTGVIQKKIIGATSLVGGTGTVAGTPTTSTGALMPGAGGGGSATFAQVKATVGSILVFDLVWDQRFTIVSVPPDALAAAIKPAMVSVHIDGSVTAASWVANGLGIVLPVTDASPHDYRIFVHSGASAVTLNLLTATLEEITQ